MKIRFLTFLLAMSVQPYLSAEESWGPDLLKFQLEDTDAKQAMIWISGFSYSTTALLRSSGCLAPTESVSSKELILALNRVYSGQTISAEQATSVLEKLLGERCQ